MSWLSFGLGLIAGFFLGGDIMPKLLKKDKK
jgi:uncharacterized protein YneF (UPF0154 family)